MTKILSLSHVFQILKARIINDAILVIDFVQWRRFANKSQHHNSMDLHSLFNSARSIQKYAWVAMTAFIRSEQPTLGAKASDTQYVSHVTDFVEAFEARNVAPSFHILIVHHNG